VSEIEIKGIKELVGRLEGVERSLAAGIEAAAIHVKGKVAEAPPVRRGPMPMTPRQRAWFLMALREGLIEVPWRRGSSPLSERLSQSWTSEMRDERSAVVGNDTSYGPFVQDREKQSRYHEETGWKTIQAVAEAEAEKARDIVASVVRKAIGD
jgi:predicted GTPase